MVLPPVPFTGTAIKQGASAYCEKFYLLYIFYTVEYPVILLLANQTIQRYAPHNDVSVNDGPHLRRYSYKIIIL